MRKTVSNIIATIILFGPKFLQWLGALMDLLELPEAAAKISLIADRLGNNYWPVVFLSAGILLLIIINWPSIKAVFVGQKPVSQKPKKPLIYGRQIDPDRIYIAPKPNMRMSEALDYVTGILVPNQTGDISSEQGVAAKAITGKIKEGKLKTWGKRVRIKNDFGIWRYKVNTDRDEFSIADWKHRELLPLEAGIPSEKNPQTTSSGRDDDHTQFTALEVNQEQIHKLWPSTDNTIHDMWVLHAIYRVIEYKHGMPYERVPNPEKINDVKAACSKIRQYAGDGKLDIWGCFGRDEFLREIPSDYWENYQIALTSVLGGTNDPKEVSTEAATIGMRVGMIYKGLKTTSSQVNQLWPPENT